MRGMMGTLAARSSALQDRRWAQYGREPGIRRYVGDPAGWPVVPVQPRWLSWRCGFDVRLPQLAEMSARLDELQNAYDAFAQDMDQKGHKWTKDIRDNSQAVRENAQAVQQAEQGSIARDDELSAKIEDIGEGSAARDTELSAKIDDVDEGSVRRDAGLSAAVDDVRQIDYSPYFERMISAQYDYRPLLSSMIQAQERAERRLEAIAENTEQGQRIDYAPYFERMISSQSDYRRQLDVIIANQ